MHKLYVCHKESFKSIFEKKKKQKKFEIVEYILKQNLYGLNLKSYLKHCSNS